MKTMKEIVKDNLDKEWVKLIRQAKEIGLTPDEVRAFIKENEAYQDR